MVGNNAVDRSLLLRSSAAQLGQLLPETVQQGSGSELALAVGELAKRKQQARKLATRSFQFAHPSYSGSKFQVSSKQVPLLEFFLL